MDISRTEAEISFLEMFVNISPGMTSKIVYKTKEDSILSGWTIVL